MHCTWGRSVTNLSLPSSHAELCSQELQVGTCNDRIRSFFYDIASQRCKRFFYSGCGGNDNRFATRQACQRTCSGVVEPVDPCARLECSAGSRCKVNKETGMPFCEKSCEYDNGGCAAREICRLRQLNCLVPPCPPLIDCLQPRGTLLTHQTKPIALLLTLHLPIYPIYIATLCGITVTCVNLTIYL